MTKLSLNQWVKDVTASWWLSLANNPSHTFYFLLLLFLPVQLGKHFWPTFSFLDGLRIDYLSVIIYFTDVLFFLFFISSREILKKLSRRTWIILGCLFFYLFLRGVLSISPLNSLVGILRLGEYAYIAFATSVFLQEKKLLKKAVFVIALSTLFVSLLAFLQFFLQHSVGGVASLFGERTFSQQTPGIANASLYGTLVLRPYATFPHPNVLAGFLLVSLTVTLYFFPLFRKDTWQKIVIRISFLLSISALFLTLSRTALLAFLVVIFIWFFARKKVFSSRFLLVLVTLFCLFVFSGVLFRFTSLTLEDETIVLRIEQFRNAFLLFLSSPLFGVGYKNYLPALSEIMTTFYGVRFLQPVHNIFALVAVETGIVGLTLFLAGIIKVGKTIFVQKQRLFPLSLCLIFLITGMLDHYWYTLHQGQLLAAFVIGLIFVKYR